jgi:Transposase DDE domain group 1
MPTECSRKPMGFARVDGRAVVADFDGGAITSNAGGLLLGATDRAIGLVERFAACFADGRAAERVVHEVATLVGQRVFGIALGYEDLIDHDRLRHDPVLGVVLGRLEARHGRCAPLAGKSTLNRLEHGATAADRYRRIAHDGAAIEALFVELFLDAHTRPPKEIMLDLDATDDPLHGHQEGRFFHGYYDCHCYLPLYVFCGRHLLAAKLRRADIDASAGAVEEVARIVGQLRACWPKVRIVLRGDSGFAREPLMAWCEDNRVDYLFGLARNPRLVEHIHVPLAWAEHDAEASGRPARRFADFRWTTRESWSRRRRVVAKAEWMPGRGAKGANPRFVVTSLKAARADARTLYEQMYCARGEMENRIKECQLDLFADIGVPHSLLCGVGPHQRCDHARQPAPAVVRLHGLRARHRAAPHRPRRHRARHRHLRQHPPEAPEDRRPGHPQRPPHPHRHGLELPRRRGVPPRPRPIMRLIRNRPRPAPSVTNQPSIRPRPGAAHSRA